ncbi:tyrosine-type recombinase/integrase [Methylobacter tundripaludum]|uniref:tyrosine-type recombinase/integrase n=1 Tax=Methylobacter tundripaludum TaxID=173365 RepID=UPI0004DF3609|nr:integrase family protein [Methylobacter tundripaludum]
MKLIKSVVDKLDFTEKGQVFYWDDELPGFGMYIGTKSKTWCVQQRIGNKTKRVVLGKYPTMTAKKARDDAKEAIGKLAAGTDIVQEEREKNIKAVTLGEVFTTFLDARQLKPKTVMDYTGVMNNIYPDWQKLPITDITRDAVERRHKKIGVERGEAYANLGARTLRSVLNYASAKYETGKGLSILPENPVKRISQTRSWYKVERRTGHLKHHQLATWFDAVLNIDNDTIRDYLIFVLLTGTRKDESAKLQWTDIDLVDNSYILRDPKNGRPMQLPLSDYLANMLTTRKASSNSAFVFPGDGVRGYLVEPKRQIAKIVDKTGLPFAMHDLRRSFVTIAESLDISSFAVKALVNHKSGDDVTSGYIQLNVERLRKPMQTITDFILKSAGIKVADVVEFKATAQGGV